MLIGDIVIIGHMYIRIVGIISFDSFETIIQPPTYKKGNEKHSGKDTILITG